jgi:plasmid maintenance system antidote protein VapI
MSASVGGIVLRDSARAAEKALGVTKAIARRIIIGSKRITPKMQLLKHRVVMVVGKYC